MDNKGKFHEACEVQTKIENALKELTSPQPKVAPLLDALQVAQSYFLTSSHDTDRRLIEEINDVITKPTQPQKLKTTLESILQRMDNKEKNTGGLQRTTKKIEEHTTCKWMGFDISGNEINCNVDGCDVWNKPADAEIYCKYCIEGKKFDALVEICDVLKESVSDIIKKRETSPGSFQEMLMIDKYLMILNPPYYLIRIIDLLSLKLVADIKDEAIFKDTFKKLHSGSKIDEGIILEILAKNEVGRVTANGQGVQFA